MNAIFDVLGPLLEGVPLALVPLSPCQNNLANWNKKSDPGYDKIKVFPGHMVQLQTCDCISAKEKSSCRRLLYYVWVHNFSSL